MYSQPGVGPHGVQQTEAQPSLRAALDRELDPGERLVWQGQPRPDLARAAAWKAVSPGFFVVGIIGLLLAGLVWSTVTTYLAARSASAGGAQHAEGIGGLITLSAIMGSLVALGLWGMLTEPGRAAERAKRTVYAISDRRAIVLSQSRRGVTTERDFSPEETRCVLRRELPCGAGDIVFESPRTMRSPSGALTPGQLGFLHVERCAEVERVLRTTLQTGPERTRQGGR